MVRTGSIRGAIAPLGLAFALPLAALLTFSFGRNHERAAAAAAPAASHMSLPLAFEENRGQASDEVDYLARGDGYAVALDRGIARVGLEGHRADATVAMRVVGAGKTGATAANRLSGVVNYLVGDRSQWITGVSTFAEVRYPRILPGINLSFHGQGRQLEYDFGIAPGADPSAIRVAFDGAADVRVDGDGALVLRLGDRTLRQPKPTAWQTIDGAKQEVEVRYRELSRAHVGFAVGHYDSSRPLLIDPVLTYSTYLGGVGDDDPTGVAVDSAGNAYVVGTTASADFPTANGVKTTLASGDRDAFVTKFNPTGTAVVYSTYLGGSFSAETARDLAVDGSGHAYVTGETMSPDFPTANAYDASFGGPGDAFVTKLSADGASLDYSTFLGGATGGDPNIFSAYDYGYGIAVDSAGSAYVTGQTDAADFPTVNAIQSAPVAQPYVHDAFVAKLAPSGGSLVYSTYLSGSDSEAGRSVAVDASGRAVVTGETSSPDFPTAQPLQSGRNGDAFVSKLSADGRSFVYSTFLGGLTGEDRGTAVAVDATGNAYVTGWTNANDFPTTPGAWSRTCAQGAQYCGYQSEDAFVTKIAADGSALAYSTYFGAMGREYANGIAVNGVGQATIVGTTEARQSDGFPNVDSFQPSFGGGIDGYVMRLSADGSALVFSSYLGANWYDVPADVASGNADDELFVTGSTNSTNFITTPGAFDRIGGETCADYGRCDDAFVVKITTSQTASDTTPPTATITSPKPGDVVRGTTTITADVADDTAVWRVEFLVNGRTVGYDSFAPYEASWYTGYDEGSVTITVQATDPFGNVGTSAPVQVVVDNNTAPDTFITSGPTGTVESTDATFTFASSDASATFECTLDGTLVDAFCVSPKTYTGLSAGTHTFSVRARNAAGNFDPSPASTSWTVVDTTPADTTPPDTFITDGPSGTVDSTQATFAFKASEPASSFECVLDGTSVDSDCHSPTTYTGLTGGPHTFTVRATDLAGNVDGSPASASWFVWNDDFDRPWPLKGSSATGSNVGATLEPNEPRHARTRGGASVWFTWSAGKTSGTAVFDTAGSDFDTILAVYTGDDLASLTEVAASSGHGDRSARVSFRVAPARTYRIVIDGKNNATGTYRLGWSLSK
jgi:hypothetical protein